MSSGKMLDRAAKLKSWNQDVTDRVKAGRARLLDSWDLSVSKLTRQDISRKLTKVGSCGGLLELRAPLDEETGELGDPVLHNADFCGQIAVCPMCAARLQARRQSTLKDPITAFAKRFRHAYLVTATIADGGDLRARLDHLVRSWQRFRLMGQKRKGVLGPGEWGKVHAALAHVEIKRGARSGLWHPHIHALVFSNDPLDYRTFQPEALARGEKIPLRLVEFAGRKVASSKVTREWLRASGDSMGLDVRPLGIRKGDREKGIDRTESIWRQAREVLKYATKFNSAPAADQTALMGPDYVTVMDVTWGRRLFNSYGGFRGLAALNNEMVESLDLAAGARPVVYSMRWDKRARKYDRLRAEDGPLFENSDPIRSEKKIDLIRTVNRVQGAFRRRRYRILHARPYFARRGRLEEWESWIDKNTAACNSAIWEVRENHRMGDPNYFDAMMKAREDEDRLNLAFWDRYSDKEQGTIEGFRWILNHPPPPASPPPGG